MLRIAQSPLSVFFYRDLVSKENNKYNVNTERVMMSDWAGKRAGNTK